MTEKRRLGEVSLPEREISRAAYQKRLVEEALQNLDAISRADIEELNQLRKIIKVASLQH